MVTLKIEGNNYEKIDYFKYTHNTTTMKLNISNTRQEIQCLKISLGNTPRSLTLPGDYSP